MTTSTTGGATVADERLSYEQTPSALTRYRLGSGARTLLTLPVLFLTVAVALPMGYVLWLALFGEGESTVGSVVGDPLFREALWRTVVMAVLVTVLCVVLGLVYALAVTLAPRPVKVVLGLAIGATFVISLMVRTYGWVLLLQPRGIVFDALSAVGLVDGPLAVLQTPSAMYLGMVHVMLPYSILLTSTSLAALDGNLVKAARSMGASARLTFFRVVLPQIAAGVTAGGLLVFMISLGFYITPAFLGGPSQLTMGTLIGKQMSGTFDFKAAAIMGSLLFLAVTVLYVLAERIFKITDQWERR
ncbi:ABC transporter permease [Kineococcus sp. SYSU DK001]|uniref:ABC transporter permease n=1 Tax=Kineococcus sp. SYSU DK001 TaxID=3383122 RepID=UPI003D7E3CAD